MKNKIITLNINDIIINPEEQSSMITTACNREIPMVVTGICQLENNLLLSLEELHNHADAAYILAPFNSVNIDEVSTEIGTRFFSGFSHIGSFDVKLDKWALFKYFRNPSVHHKQ